MDVVRVQKLLWTHSLPSIHVEDTMSVLHVLIIIFISHESVSFTVLPVTITWRTSAGSSQYQTGNDDLNRHQEETITTLVAQIRGPNLISHLYLYSFSVLWEQFYKFLLSVFLRSGYNNYQVVPFYFPFHLPTLPRVAITFLIYISMIKSISSFASYKWTFLSRHIYR